MPLIKDWYFRREKPETWHYIGVTGRAKVAPLGCRCDEMMSFLFIATTHISDSAPGSRFAGNYIADDAGETAWREDNRRVDNGKQAAMVGVALMTGGVSRQWGGYWQRAA